MFRSLLNSPGSLQEMKMIKTAKKRRTKAALRAETPALTRETRRQTRRKPVKGWGCADGFLPPANLEDIPCGVSVRGLALVDGFVVSIHRPEWAVRCLESEDKREPRGNYLPGKLELWIFIIFQTTLAIFKYFKVVCKLLKLRFNSSVSLVTKSVAYPK